MALSALRAKFREIYVTGSQDRPDRPDVVLVGIVPRVLKKFN